MNRYLSLIEETTAPAWKPGQRVPAGYMVVFGKLVPSHKVKMSDSPEHHASTEAWRASSRHARRGDEDSKAKAARLHLQAAEHHRAKGNEKEARAHEREAGRGVF